MGLGAPRKRSKISHDPNNTSWSRSTTNFGHKLLLSQGWTPGSYLGAVNAPHAYLHSDANASHIRVAIKDDNLGLGAKRGSGQGVGECTGLDVFQNLLGRLNGKSDVVLEKEQKSRNDLKRALYTEKRFGALRFVRGGVLVGDRIEKLVEGEKSRLVEQSSSPLDQQSFATSQEKGRNEAEGHIKAILNVSKFTELSLPLENAAPEPDKPNPIMENLEATVDMELKNSKHDRNSDKAKRKAEKAQKKVKRQQRKETRRTARAERHPGIVPPCTMSSTDQQSEPQNAPRPNETRSSSVVAVAAAMSGRHAVRQRYIKQKRLAVMDLKALNEILMVKA